MALFPCNFGSSGGTTGTLTQINTGSATATIDTEPGDIIHILYHGSRPWPSASACSPIFNFSVKTGITTDADMSVYSLVGVATGTSVKITNPGSSTYGVFRWRQMRFI